MPRRLAGRAGACAGAAPLLVGERRGETLPGFDLGNSPLEVAGPHIRGRVVLLTTSNGTRALLAARTASAIGVAGFVNLAAAAAWPATPGRPVTLACAGERGAVSLEDQVCAGLLAAHLEKRGPPGALTPAAREAARVAAVLRHVAGATAGGFSVGPPPDPHRAWPLSVDACLSLDTSTLVPVYRPDVDEFVSCSSFLARFKLTPKTQPGLPRRRIGLNDDEHRRQCRSSSASLSRRPGVDALIAAVIFILASITDWLDGVIARQRNQVTTPGTLLDPIADKLLVASALVSLLQIDKIAGWIVAVIIGRELADLTGLRAVAAGVGVIVPASRLAKLEDGQPVRGHHPPDPR